MEFRSGSVRLPTPILVVGVGISGKSVLRLLGSLGAQSQDIFSYDDKDPTAQLRNVEDALRLNPQTLVVSPGVPLSTPWIKKLQGQGSLVTSELEFASQFLKNEKILGITGSVGKSTVVAILGQGLADQGFVGGNFGDPLANYICDVHEGKRTRVPWIVLELSSYQLENFPSLLCDASAVISLTANHLERYESKHQYYKTKLSLIFKTKGPIVFNHSGFDLIPLVRKEYGNAKVRSQFTSTDRKDPLVKQVLQKNTLLLGAHNLDNLAVCVRLAQLLDFPEVVIERFFTFGGLPHRLENLGISKGVLFVNDSKATTIASVVQAVLSLKSRIQSAETFHLMLGGKDKNLPWEDLKNMGKIRNARFYFFGESASRAHRLSGLLGDEYKSLTDAISAVLQVARKNDFVLLSPGGTSLDEFKSFEHRGQAFRKEIEQWSRGPDQPE